VSYSQGGSSSRGFRHARLAGYQIDPKENVAGVRQRSLARARRAGAGEQGVSATDNELCAADIAVIIITYNSRRYFARQKRALESQTIKGFRLIVWDNASAIAERPRADDFPEGADIILHDANIGFAGAINEAAKRAPKAHWIALLNPDAFPEPNWLEELLAAQKRWPKAAAFGSTQINAENPNFYDGLGDAYHIVGAPWRAGFGQRRTNNKPLEGETFSVCAAAALYHGDAWRRAGGFDEDFFAFGEDVDLGFRLRLMGHVCVQAAGAIVYHVGGASAARRSDFATFYGRRNRTWIFFKNMPAPLFYLLLPAHLGMALLTLAACIGKPTFTPTWRAFRATFLDWRSITAKRHSGKSLRRLMRNYAALHFTWNPLALVTRGAHITQGSMRD
jgi:GT2 family glycosyltransferase